MQRVFFWFGLCMSFLYVFLGAVILGSNLFSGIISDRTTRIILGLVLTAYGFFRGYMHYKNRGGKE